MHIIVGLGNPTSKYEGTRHNIGFDVIDELASQMGVQVNTRRHKALCGIGMIGNEKVILVKPQTYRFPLARPLKNSSWPAQSKNRNTARGKERWPERSASWYGSWAT